MRPLTTALSALAIALLLPALSQAQDPVQAVKSKDANGDGKVSPSEWTKSPKAFKNIDKDKDGFITPEDYAKHWGIELSPKAVVKSAPDGTLTIADVHMHPSTDADPHDVLHWMDRNKVQWAGLGAKNGGREVREHYAEVMGERYIAFGGQTQINRIYLDGGNSALENPDRQDFKDLVAMLEEDFAAGKLKGIGEIFANARTTSKPFRGRKMRIDAPTNRILMDLAAKYGGVLSIHVQFDKDSVQELKALAAYNTKGRIIMAHCGSTTSPDEVRDMLKAHQNIFCDLSARHPPKMSHGLMKKKPEQKIFDAAGLKEPWRKLIEEMPDRFMVGTDTKTEGEYDKGIATIRSGLLSNLKPETAEKVAYRNAQYLLNLQ